MAEQQEDTMRITAKPMGVEYHAHLDFEIRETEQFYEFIEVLREASPDDVVFLHLNSIGGSLDVTVQVMNAIQTTQATVIACAEGLVASGAAFIFFSCHGFQIAEHSSFLIHSASGGFGGKISDVAADVTHSGSRMNNLMKSSLGGFFTKKEIKKLADGREHYLSGEEVADRIADYMEKAQEGQESAY